MLFSMFLNLNLNLMQWFFEICVVSVECTYSRSCNKVKNQPVDNICIFHKKEACIVDFEVGAHWSIN